MRLLKLFTSVFIYQLNRNVCICYKILIKIFNVDFILKAKILFKDFLTTLFFKN